MAKEYTRREPTTREATRREPTTKESTRHRIDNTKSVDQRNIERRARASERATIKGFEDAARTALGGMTLSEALRTPAAQSSTRVRRQIKETYRKVREVQNSTGVDESFDDKGVNDSTINTISKEEESNFDINTYNEKSVVIVIDGFPETVNILTT